MSKKTRRTPAPLYENVFRGIGWIFLIAAIVLGILSVLQIFDILNVNFLFLPWALICLGMENACNSVRIWKNSRVAAVVSLCCGIFLIICAMIGFAKL